MHALRLHNLIRGCIGFLFTGLVIATTSAQAAATSEQAQRQSVEQGITLVQNYLKSKTAEKITASGTVAARRLLARANDLLEQALAHLAQGNLDAAQAGLDQSIQSFSAAAVANAKPAKSNPENSVRIRETRAEIDAYLESFRAALAEKGPAMAGLLEQQHLQDLLAQAEQAQATGDFRTAESELNQAKQMVVTALIKIRNNETVVYSVEFQTPADEFRYERERFLDYVALGQKVLNNGTLEQSRKKMFDQLHDKGNQFSREAMMLAGEGDYESAIERMEDAVRKMVQGLKLLGVQLSM